jgi:hypothetical protein
VSEPICRVGAGAGFAGDRIDPAVALAASGQVDAIALECLAERTLVAALRARAARPDGGADPRLRRRLGPLIPAAADHDCRIVSNLGAANPAAAARTAAALAGELGRSGLRVAAVLGDDVAHLAGQTEWERPIEGRLLGAHAYLGADGMAAALAQGADIVLAGRVADSALFAAPVLAQADADDALRAGALTVGHPLECSGQLTGGNFEPPGGGLDAAALAGLGFPFARVMADGSAELAVLEDAPAWLDPMTCTLQLLYEVHDPSCYITPDAVLDFTGVRFESTGRNRVGVSGARLAGRPDRLKIIAFVERRGVIADAEIGYAGSFALDRARLAADTLRLRLRDWPEADLTIDMVGVNSILGAASASVNAAPPELRVHVSARCEDAEAAQVVEDEVYALTLSGPAGGAGIRSERRPRVETVSGLIPRALVPWSLAWEVAP